MASNADEPPAGVVTGIKHTWASKALLGKGKGKVVKPGLRHALGNARSRDARRTSVWCSCQRMVPKTVEGSCFPRPTITSYMLMSKTGLVQRIAHTYMLEFHYIYISVLIPYHYCQ